jgi:hypothetical protein
VLLIVSVLVEASYLPERVHLRYLYSQPAASNSIQHGRHYYPISLGFLVTRIVGFSLVGRGLYRGGPEVEKLLLPSADPENGIAS